MYVIRGNKLKIQLAEILILGSALLLYGGQSTPGWVFFGCGLFIAFARFAVENQQRVTLENDIEKSVNTIKEAFPGFVQAMKQAGLQKQNQNRKSNVH